MYHDPSADLHARGPEHCPPRAAGTAENVSFRARVILSTNEPPHQHALYAPDVIACLGSFLHRLSPLLHGTGLPPLHSRWAVRRRDYQAEFGCKSIGCVCGGVRTLRGALHRELLFRSNASHVEVVCVIIELSRHNAVFSRQKDYSCLCQVLVPPVPSTLDSAMIKPPPQPFVKTTEKTKKKSNPPPL